MIKEGEPASKAIPIAISKAKRMMKSTDRKTYHLVPYDGHWLLRDSYKGKDIYKFDTKDSALGNAHKLAEKDNVHVVIHRRDGKIQKHIS
jgi:uncharacterized protein YdaT